MLTKTIRILFLEDLPADAEMAKRELKNAGTDFVDKVVETEEAFRKELIDFQPDIIISDYSLPSFDGMSALKIVRKHTHYIPFIILTGSMNEETAVNCMKSGANDYVIKEQIKRLPYAVQEAIEANKIRLEKKRMLEELIEAKEKAEESDRLKTAFLANMSHEIRTPMNGILGFTELLSNPQLSGEQKSQYIDIIRKSGQRMLNTVNDIIEASKIETGQVKPSISPVSICLVIEELVSFFKGEAEQKGLNFNFEKNANPGIILTDLTKFTSIISNLIKNAIKYTDHGSITVGCREGKDQVVFFVRDTGIGIPADRQKAVFNRFEQADIGDTRAFQGSGLGLSIAKSYVEMLGGEIWLESEEGKGAEFSFTIPYQTESGKKPNDHKQEMIKMNETKNTKLKILIAEDEESATIFLSIVLQERAAEFLYATTGTETVELCKKNPDIDVILMDIKMPEMDGYTATQRIRKFNKDVVIIAQTAYAITGDREKALEAGCNGYISKPINEDELLDLIDQLV